MDENTKYVWLVSFEGGCQTHKELREVPEEWELETHGPHMGGVWEEEN